MSFSIVEETDLYLELNIQKTNWQDSKGWDFIEKDYRVKGEVWRVHKSDADPFPSSPHAHCISGTGLLPGCKLHLGNRKLYKGAKFIGRWLSKKEFKRLIELVKPKFPKLELPLPEY